MHTLFLSLIKNTKLIRYVLAIAFILFILFYAFDKGRDFERAKHTQQQLDFIFKQANEANRKRIEYEKVSKKLLEEREVARKEVSRVKRSIANQVIPICNVEKETIQDINSLIKSVNK